MAGKSFDTAAIEIPIDSVSCLHLMLSDCGIYARENRGAVGSVSILQNEDKQREMNRGRRSSEIRRLRWLESVLYSPSFPVVPTPSSRFETRIGFLMNHQAEAADLRFFTFN